MVRTESKDVEVGVFQLPEFELEEPLTGKPFSSSSLAGSPAVVMFICNHCPFVILLKQAIKQLAADYAPRGVKFVAVNSNSVVTHPQDGPDAMAVEARDLGYGFPYVFDSTQDVAKAFKAACTPEFYAFSADGKLQYHGQFDGARPSAEDKRVPTQPVTGADLRAALDDVLAGRPVAAPQRRALGCNIKFAPGNEPDYFRS